MTDLKCVVEGCNLEYDVICSFSFYNVNTGTDNETKRQQWIEGAMQDEKECLWRHVSLQLCGYHFELDSQGLWIDSPMLPELLTLQDKEPPKAIPTEEDKKAAEIVRKDHCYHAEEKEQPADISRLNVRQLVDTLGYLSLKSLQRKQLWVVKVETDKNEASITQSEQVITKMSNTKQVIEILPQTSQAESSSMQHGDGDNSQQEVMTMIEESAISDNFIYEIAEEQEIAMEEVKEIPVEHSNQWTVNILPEQSKPKYAYIKHTSTGKKKRHFTADLNEVTLQQGDFENYYILPDADPSLGVEVTTSYEPENYIVEEYSDIVLDQPPSTAIKRREPESSKKRKKRAPKAIQIKGDIGEDWVIENAIVYDQDTSEDYDDKKGRVRRKNTKYLGNDWSVKEH